MPTKFYGGLATKADIEEVKAGDGAGLVEVLCKITLAKRIDLSDKEWDDEFDSMARKGYRDVPEYEVRRPLSLSFKEEGNVSSSGVTLTDALQIMALLSEYGVEKPEDLIGKPALIYKRNVAKPGEEPVGSGTIAFSRPEE